MSDLLLSAAPRLVWLCVGPDLVVSRGLNTAAGTLWIYPRTVVTLPAYMIE